VTREVEAEQPYITRLTRLGQAASDAGQGVAFIYEVSGLIFGGTQNWHEGDHLAEATERAGLDLAILDAAIEESGAAYEAKIEDNHAALDKSAHWGVPTMVWNDETFFGQDRIDTLVWRLEANGLTKRR
jgi:2-hydroxychromene-2-carboxylate isomerase